MTDARQQILLLPPLELSPEEWAELTAVMNSLENKTIENFQSKFEELKSEFGSILNPKNIPKLILFLTAWFNTTQSIVLWINYLNTVWANVTKKNMGADNLIPLIIELLPDDVTQLQLLQAKLELALRIAETGERGSYLTNILIATSIKISESSEKKPTTDHIISTVVMDLCKMEQISQLIPVCINYKNYLRDTFILLFQAADKNSYQQYVEICGEISTDLDKNLFIDILIENISKCNLTMNNPDLIPVLDKYFVLYDMHATLYRQNQSATDRLLEFSAKFIQHFDILTKNLDSNTRSFLKRTSANLGINRVYEYIGWEDPETQFLKLAGFFSQKTQPEEDAKEDVKKNSAVFSVNNTH